MIPLFSRPSHQTLQRGRIETLTVLLTHVTTLLLTIALQSALARLLGTDGRGTYAVLLLFGTSFGVFFTAGIDRASQYSSMSGSIPMWNAISSALLVLAAGSIIAISLGMSLMRSNFAFFQHASTTQFAAALPLIPVSMLLTLFQLHTAGKRLFSTLAWGSVIQGATNLLLLFALASVSDDDISAAIWAYTTSAALATTIFATKLWRIEQPQDPPRLQHLKEIGLYGMRYYFARIGNLVDLGIGTALLSAVAESSSVGIFAATSALALKTLLITESAESTILPRIAQDPEKSIDLTLRTFRFCVYVTLVIVIGLCIASPLIIPLMFSTSFSDGSGIILAMAPGLIAQAGSGILMAHFRGTNRPAVCSTAVWLSLCSNVVVFYALYPALGFHAAGISMTAGFLTRAGALIVAFRQCTSVSISRLLLPTSNDVAYFLDILRTTIGKAVAIRRP